MVSYRYQFGLSALLLMLSEALVSAQAIEEPNDTEAEINKSVRRVYLPDEFARFAPRSALDMVNQIPGFTLREGGGDRGFGQVDTNVLINGRRISGKSNGPVEALGRITAESVKQLVILDGASLDLGGLSGQVLNVVTTGDGQITGRFRITPQFRQRQSIFSWRNFETSITGGSEKSEWTLSASNEQSEFAEQGPEEVFDGFGQLTDVRPEERYSRFDAPNFSGSYTREASNGSVLNLTGEVNGFLLDFEEVSPRLQGTALANSRTLITTEDEVNFELGGDYEFAVPGGRLKVIGLYRYENSPTVDDVRTDFADARPIQGTVFTRQANEAEAIIRTEYGFDALGGNWRWSVEGTDNFLDITSALDSFDANGSLQPVGLPGANSRVEESRAETTMNYSRSLTKTLQLQSSIGVEYSEIRQSGDDSEVRDFVRPKGFVSLNWKPKTGLAISGKLERVVGQLGFFDVIASVNIDQDRVNVTNVNLVPEQSWLAEVEIQQSLGDYGNLTVSGFYEDITDIVDRIPISGGGQAPGNIDSATRLGASINSTLLSDPTGWRGGRLDVAFDYTDSDVLDPITGQSRRISNDDFINMDVTFRQDFMGTEWATGWSVSYLEETPNVRLDEISFFRESFAFAEAFVENKDVYGMTVRATVGNLLNSQTRLTRSIFNDRLTNDIAFSEDRIRNVGLVFTLAIEGSF